MVPDLFSIRKATEADVVQIGRLFSDTIQLINEGDYNMEQTAVWSSVGKDKDRWGKKIRDQYFVVAETGLKVTGFASGTSAGYLDTLYVDKDHQGKGIGKALLDKVEKHANSCGAKEMLTEASITAKPFFFKAGYRIDKEQKKVLKEVVFINYCMRKTF